MRIGRGYPQQSFNVQGQALGLREPTVFAPVVTTLSVNLASGILVNQRRAQMCFPRQGWEPGLTQTTEASPQTWGSLSRRLGPTPPELIGPLPTQQQQTITSRLRAVDRVQAGYQRRAPRSSLPLVVLATATFIAAPIQTNLVDNRIRGYGRRHFPSSVLYPPTVLQVFAAGRFALAQLRPRKTGPALRAPTAIRVPSVEQREQTVAVALVHTRPRPTAKTLRSPTVLQTFAGPVETEVAIRIPLEDRRRLSHAHLTPPTVVRIPSVEQREQTLIAALVRTRPRAKTGILAKPTALQVFAGPLVKLTRTRPRTTARFLAEPTVIRVPSVEQLEQTVRVALVHTRPRPTSRALSRPTVLQVFVTGKPNLVATRPRKTSWKLAPPTLVRVPSVEQQEDSIRVALVRTRPRPTTKALGEPTVLLVPSVEQKRVTLTAWLTKSRPHPTGKRLAPPTAVISNPPVASTISVALVAVRRATEQRRHMVAHFLRAPTVVIAPPTLRMQTISAVLVRTRPRPTAHRRTEPSVVRTLAARQLPVTLARIRPPKTTLALSVGLILSRPSQLAQTIRTTLVAVRPPKTAVALSPGIIRSRPSQLAQTIRTTLVTVRPRATQKLLAQPVRVAPPPTLAQQTLRVAYENAVTTRTSLLRRPSSHLIHPPTAVRAQRDAEFELGELGDGWHAGMPTEGWQSGERAPDWKPGTPSTGWLSDTIGGSWRADKPQS